MPFSANCPICNSSKITPFFQTNNLPVLIGQLWPDNSSAINCPKGDVQLFFCGFCGFIWNHAFNIDNLQYTQAYDNSLHFSPFYENYARSVAERLVKEYNLYNKTIVEIGCGKGDFLIMMCKIGNNKGIGFDKSYEPREIEKNVAKYVTFINDLFTEENSRQYKADLICSRYVLEHIPDPVMFLKILHRSMKKKKQIVYTEVPNTLLILEKLSIWDIIYEHCSYFSSESLAYIFKKCGFEIINLRENFDQQFLGIECCIAENAVSDNILYPDVDHLNLKVKEFSDKFISKMSYWEKQLQDFAEKGKKVVIWGAGAKGVSFLNLLKDSSHIEYAVDVNPNKHGKYIAGAGQLIVPPDFLKKYRPDIIILMNSIYRNEIQASVEDLGLDPEYFDA